jgi:hypothetical protein
MEHINGGDENLIQLFNDLKSDIGPGLASIYIESFQVSIMRTIQTEKDKRGRGLEGFKENTKTAIFRDKLGALVFGVEPLLAALITLIGEYLGSKERDIEAFFEAHTKFGTGA